MTPEIQAEIARYQATTPGFRYVQSKFGAAINAGLPSDCVVPMAGGNRRMRVSGNMAVGQTYNPRTAQWVDASQARELSAAQRVTLLVLYAVSVSQ